MKGYLFFIIALLLASSVTWAQPVEIFFGSPIPSQCRTLAVPVIVNNFSDIGAISLKLNFDNTILEYQSVNLNDNIEESVYKGNNAIGEFALSFYGDGITFQEGEVLFILHFSVLETSEEKSKLTWDNDLFKENCEFAGPDGVPVYSGTFVDGEILIPTELIATVAANPILCNGETTEVTVSASGGNPPYSGTGTFTVGAGSHSYIVSDENGCEFEVSISIPEPEPLQINSLTVSPSVPIQINSNVELVANFTGNILVDVNIDWGDGTFSSFENIDDGVIADNHIYNRTSVNSIKIEINDKCENRFSYNYDYVVVYDPSIGFVTGGGWIMSPEGAYVFEPLLTGKATFGFVSKYQKGKSVPTGKTEFQFHAAGMNFASASYAWLVVTGSSKAQFEGKGTINGKGNYGFMLTAIDGGNDDSDKFRIRIWDIDKGDFIVYDNKMDSEIGSGSIVIHFAKIKSEEIVTNLNPIQLLGILDFKVFPNPFSDCLVIQFCPTSDSHACFELLSMNGMLLETVFDGQVIGKTLFSMEYQPNLRVNQMLIYRLTINETTRIGKLIFKYQE